ncbi:phage tail assembly chaperone [Acidovorax sp. LjRoot74]|uniref:phage tail assembly chaperone n=1 Tax=Acidovorax sp. LjRoot74 TaxID=3342337 RepID=UPI003ECE28DB
MAKIKLGNRPASFKKTVSFDMLEGGKGTIECVFKYRTKSEFGEFIDKLIEAAGATPKDDGEKFSMADLMDRTSGANADYILDVLQGWNLDEDLNKSNVQQLADELPAAAAAIMETYRTAVTEGRLGN